MPLKVDYKDDGFAGNRKYRQVNNADGSVSFEDITPYNPVGDSFGAKDINSTNTEINKVQQSVTATLTASGWSATAPYTQTVNVTGITAEDSPIISIYLPSGITAANVKAQSKAWGMVDRAVTGSGTITFYCYNKKPIVDFQAQIKGV